MATVVANPDPLMAEAEPHAQKTVSKTEHEGGKVRSVNSSSQNDDGFDSDGKDWDNGVLRVRAITSVWSRKAMWTMFAL
jgi:hypothetical protein